jgi:hypothetical protein
MKESIKIALNYRHYFFTNKVFKFFSLRTKSPNSASPNIKIYRKITLIDPKLWKGWPLVGMASALTRPFPPKVTALLLQGHSHQRSSLCSYKAIPTKGHIFALTRPFPPKVTPLLLQGHSHQRSPLCSYKAIPTKGHIFALTRPFPPKGHPCDRWWEWPCKSKDVTFGGNGLVRAKCWPLVGMAL